MTESAANLVETHDGRDGPDAPITAPVAFRRLLVALDNSDHANRAVDEAARLAASADGVVTGIHAYAARMHDRRFRQMEGGLPERYREEGELERQRQVHDDLITRGLNIVSDSYHGAARPTCEAAGIAYRALNPEGGDYQAVDRWVNQNHWLTKVGGEWKMIGGATHETPAQPGSRRLELHPLF